MLRIVCIILLTWICAMLLLSLGGCEVLKGKREVRTDSTSVKKVDTATVKVNTSTSKDSSTWWKETIEFLLNKPNGDTMIVNNYPVRIIREGGTRVQEQEKTDYTSEVGSRLGIVAVSHSEETKTKETKPPMWLNVLMIAGGIILLCVFLVVIAVAYSKIKNVIK
jgi:hypothetical protein